MTLANLELVAIFDGKRELAEAELIDHMARTPKMTPLSEGIGTMGEMRWRDT